MSTCIHACTPVFDVSSVAIDQTTGIATITVNAASLPAGLFNLRFNNCCQRLSPCFSEKAQIVAGTTTYANVIGRSGNFVKIGQLSRQVNVCRIVHCNLTTDPSGNVMILDKLPCCPITTDFGTTPTVYSIET